MTKVFSVTYACIQCFLQEGKDQSNKSACKPEKKEGKWYKAKTRQKTEAEEQRHKEMQGIGKVPQLKSVRS